MPVALKTRAYAAHDPKSPLAPFEFERREPKATDLLIDVKYCGICHSDIHQVRDEWGGSIFPMVPGHEIVGIVSRVGDKVSKFKSGDRVGVGCFVDSCRTCESCKEGLEQYCESGMVGTYNSYEKDKVTPTYGGYSTQIVVDENYVLRIPDNLSLDAAAPLLCAGITTYSPLMHWKAGPGMKVAVIGMGGLGHMAVKIANALGSHVTVISRSLNKKDDGLRMGARDYYASSDPSTYKNLANTFDLIINTVSAGSDMDAMLNMLKRDGTMILVGAPPESISLRAFSLIPKRRSFAGSMIGGIRETQEMLDFCGKHNIVSDIEIIPAAKINEAYERVMKGDVRYRFVIDISSLHQQS